MKNKIIYFTLISISLLIFSCETDSNLGYNILPEDDLLDLQITDTVTLDIRTKQVDSLVTNGVISLLLGEYIDPIFGQTKASYVCEYALVDIPSYQADQVIDSAVLYLSLDTIETYHYGNLSANQDIKIYKLNERLVDTISYYSKAEYNNISIGDLIGYISYTPNIEDTIIRIKLSDTFAESFENLENISTNDEFKDFFHGTYVTSESNGGDGSILKYKLDTLSTINVYYHDTEGKYIFRSGTAVSGNVRFNTFEHDYSLSSINNLDEETVLQDTVAYIQGMAGLKVIVNFPFIEKLKDLGNIAINRAELIVNTAPSIYTYEGDYPAIDAITISGLNSDGETFLLPEYYSSAGYTSISYIDGSYKYDIAGYIRDIIDGNIDNSGVLLSINSSYSNMKRSVITTSNNSKRTKLVISYTKL